MLIRRFSGLLELREVSCYGKNIEGSPGMENSCNFWSGVFVCTKFSHMNHFNSSCFLEIPDGLCQYKVLRYS